MPRETEIPPKLQQRLNQLDVDVWNMAHTSPNTIVRDTLRELHRHFFDRNKPKTAEEAENAANSLEQHLKKCTAYGNLKKSHAQDVALGNYENAARIKKSLDTFHARLFAPKLPAFLVPHAKSKSNLVLSFSHPNKTAEHSRQNAQYLANLLGEYSKKFDVVDRMLHYEPVSLDERIKKGETRLFADLFRKDVASELLTHFKLNPKLAEHYKLLAGNTNEFNDNAENRPYQQHEYSQQVTEDPLHNGILTHLSKGFEELLSDLKAHEKDSSSVAGARVVLEYSLKHNKLSDAIEIAKAMQPERGSIRSDLLKHPSEQKNKFIFTGGAASGENVKNVYRWNYKTLNRHLKPLFDKHGLPQRTLRAMAVSSPEAEKKLKPLMINFILDNLLSDYKITSQERRLIKKTIFQEFDKLQDGEKSKLIRNDNAQFILDRTIHQLDCLREGINPDKRPDMALAPSRLEHMAKIVFPKIISNAKFALETLKKA